MEQPSNRARAVGDQSHDNGREDDPPKPTATCLAAVAPLHLLAALSEPSGVEPAILRFFKMITGVSDAVCF